MWREEQSQRTKEAYKVEHKKCGSSSASGIQVTEGGGGLEGGREGAFFHRCCSFSTAAVWCVPFSGAVGL